ncbi:MAG: lytic transglycosylase domain-containing protein [Endomicrobia bacterium]|nr:lytic transglycosylase domain-containing protein [Endomicrobiia bacterium]
MKQIALKVFLQVSVKILTGLLISYSAFSQDVFSLIKEKAKKYNIDPLLFYYLIEQESSFRNCLTSPKGARGLGQLMPATARRYGLKVNSEIDERCIPEKNLDASARYLRDLLIMFQGNIPLALAGYNAGENAVIKYGNIPPYRETRNYVKKIIQKYAKQYKINTTSKNIQTENKEKQQQIKKQTISLVFQ